MTDYNRKIVVKASPQICYETITEKMADWWGDASSTFLAIDDEATVSFGDQGPAKWTFKAKELTPHKRVALQCVKEDWLGTSEWLGTELLFDIRESKEGTIIDFTHKGLVAELDCYDLCTKEWNRFIGSSLTNYLAESR